MQHSCTLDISDRASFPNPLVPPQCRECRINCDSVAEYERTAYPRPFYGKKKNRYVRHRASASLAQLLMIREFRKFRLDAKRRSESMSEIRNAQIYKYNAWISSTKPNLTFSTHVAVISLATGSGTTDVRKTGRRGNRSSAAGFYLQILGRDDLVQNVLHFFSGLTYVSGRVLCCTPSAERPLRYGIESRVAVPGTRLQVRIREMTWRIARREIRETVWLDTAPQMARFMKSRYERCENPRRTNVRLISRLLKSLKGKSATRRKSCVICYLYKKK